LLDIVPEPRRLRDLEQSADAAGKLVKVGRERRSAGHDVASSFVARMTVHGVLLPPPGARYTSERCGTPSLDASSIAAERSTVAVRKGEAGWNDIVVDVAATPTSTAPASTWWPGRHAVEAGAEVEMPRQEMFWGERYGILIDPFGHRWALSTIREQLTPDDIASRTPPDL
jgi:Glyoxalase/Bleomycin resistance protein/Dioxygenase superfamily